MFLGLLYVAALQVVIILMKMVLIFFEDGKGIHSKMKHECYLRTKKPECAGQKVASRIASQEYKLVLADKQLIHSIQIGKSTINQSLPLVTAVTKIKKSISLLIVFFP